MRTRVFVSAVVVLVSAACGGGGGTTTTTATPTAPSAPAPAPNRAPTIGSASFSPENGVDSITTFTFTASATDPDGDPITYQWNFGDGTTANGSSATKMYRSNGPFTARLAVTDNKGAEASVSGTVQVASMSGVWLATQGPRDLGAFMFTLTQVGSIVTGSYLDSVFGPGQTDPAQPGRINDRREFELRVKQGRFTDFTFRGTVDVSGRRATGGIFGSGFNGQPFTIDKQ